MPRSADPGRLSAPAIPVGSPQGIRTRGTETFVWWGVGPDGTDRVEALGSRIVVFSTPDACLAWAAGAGLARDERAETDVVDLDAVRPWLDRSTPAVYLSEVLHVVNMAIDVAASIGQSWDPRVGASCSVYGRLVAAAVPWAFEDAPGTPRWTAREFGLAQAMARRSVELLDRAVLRGVR